VLIYASGFNSRKGLERIMAKKFIQCQECQGFFFSKLSKDICIVCREPKNDNIKQHPLRIRLSTCPDLRFVTCFIGRYNRVPTYYSKDRPTYTEFLVSDPDMKKVFRHFIKSVKGKLDEGPVICRGVVKNMTLEKIIEGKFSEIRVEFAKKHSRRTVRQGSQKQLLNTSDLECKNTSKTERKVKFSLKPVRTRLTGELKRQQVRLIKRLARKGLTGKAISEQLKISAGTVWLALKKSQISKTVA
jgi:hypothetical protein